MKNIVIIGAGPAGLTCAYSLLKNKKEKYNVTIIEEDKLVGGISKTINYKGNRIDIGGHRFFTKEKKVKKIWTDILKIQSKNSYDDKVLNKEKKLPKNGLDPEKNDNVMLIRNRVSRIYYEDKFYDYPITINFQTIKNLGFLRTLQCGFSYIKSKIIKTKEKNLEEFYINRFGKKLYTMFFNKYTEKVWGRNPKNISADWGYQRVKGISILEIIKDYLKRLFNIKNKNKEISLIEEFYYPKYGPGFFYQELAKKVKEMGGKILLNSKVIKINNNNCKIESIEYKKNNMLYTKKVDIIVSSMPIKDLVNSLSKKENNVLDIANKLPYRDFITIGILVDKLKLKNKTKIKTLNNIIPDCWLYIQDENVKLGRIQIFNNWSPYMVKNINKSVWLGLEYFCNENDDFWNMSESDLINYAKNELIKIGIIEDNIIDSCCIKIKKAYPAYFGSYKDIDVVIDYLNNIDNLYCIGRNGQHRYNNMDHSMMTAIKCADVIIKNKKNKKEIWNVNIDNNYHEVKK